MPPVVKCTGMKSRRVEKESGGSTSARVVMPRHASSGESSRAKFSHRSPEVSVTEQPSVHRMPPPVTAASAVDNKVCQPNKTILSVVPANMPLNAVLAEEDVVPSDTESERDEYMSLNGEMLSLLV